MDLNEIREIIELDGGKFIVVENGKPVMAVLGFEDYKNKLKMKKTAKENPQPIMPKELQDEELKLEDLPL